MMAKQKLVPAPALADVLSTYFRYVVQAWYPEDSAIEKAARSYVLNLQREDATDEQIFDALEEMNPMMGNPLAFYEAFIEGEEESHKTATAAAVKAAKAAEEAAQAAATEFANKRKCTELEQEERAKQSAASNLTTANVTPHSLNMKADITVGDYVFVEADLSPGMHSHGGHGFVMAALGASVDRLFTVKYDAASVHGGQIERDIPYSRVTEVPTVFAATKQQRERKAPANFAQETAPVPVVPPTPLGIQAILTAGFQAGRAKGWRAKDLGVFTGERNHSERSSLACMVCQPDAAAVAAAVPAGTQEASHTRAKVCGAQPTVDMESVLLQPHCYNMSL